jgi:putative hemolysin
MNGKIKNISIAIAVGLFVLSACSTKSPQPPTPTATATRDTINMANPASAYCKEQGFKLEIRTAQDGSQYGVCMFEDDSECEEWAYYRDECKPGDMDVAPVPTATPAGIANPASTYCVEQGGASEIRTAQDNNQYGVCRFSNGSECEEWAFFRGKCAP